MLLNGSVKATTFNANVTARTVALMDEGDIFPPECIYGKDKGCQYFYEAATSIKCLNIPMKQLRSELEHNTQVKDILFERLALGYIGSLISIEALGQSRVREKIIYILRYLLQRYGEEDKDGWWRLNVRITQTDISNLIGITRETVAVELKKLKQEGIIHTGSFSYSLNMKKLIELTNTEDW